MDRNGQQLRYSNGIIKSVALKSENQIGYCEMYRSKNACLCMTAKDKKSEFGNHAQCNGMCAKQNINIYIENYETPTNKEKYNMTYDSGNLDSYPYYKALKSEGKISAINNLYIDRNLPKSKSMYSDTVWSKSSIKTDNARHWEPTKNSSNVNYYPYLNSSCQYIPEGNSCVKNNIENKSSLNHIQVNISPGVEDSLLCNEINKKYINRGNTAKNIFNAVPEQTASITVASSTCNNLYVAPPYFTVDKFANQEQADAKRNTQSSQFCSRKFYNNQRMPSNIGFDYNVPEDHSVQTGGSLLISNKEQLIGIQLLESPNIPLMRLETSIEPIGLDIRKQHRHLPIKKENFSYDKDSISERIENNQTEENTHIKVPYFGDPISRNDLIQNKSNPISFSIDQYNDTDSIELENRNLYEIADFRTTYNTPGSSQHSIAFHDLQYTQYQGNCIRESYTKKTSSNMLPPSVKNIRKPNYRELINHVHALRSATSEDDLNMQIIKRTLNYNQQPKDVPNPIISRQPTKVFRRNEDTKFSRMQNSNIFGEIYEKSSLKSHGHQSLPGGTTNIASPLDLSVKTIKTKADSTENSSNCKVIVTENGYPPKFNFRPDFSENRNFLSNASSVNTQANGIISNRLDRNQSSSEDLKSKVNLNMDINRSFPENLKSKVNLNVPSNFFEYCNRSDNDFNSKITAGDCSLENKFMLETSIPKLKGNIVCSLQNCMSSHIIQPCASQESEPGTGIKLEVTLKRTIPSDNDDDSELLRKKVCFESFYHSDYYDIDFKTTTQASETTSNIDSLDYALNKNIEELITNESEKDVQNCTAITKNEILAKNEPMAKEIRNNFIEAKQDVSSIIAARIRTKAELKGFTFQDDKDVYHQKPLSNKENCHCNYDIQSSEQMDGVNLSDWENACNNFVDQLKNYCNPLRTEIKQLKLSENKNSLPKLLNIQSADPKNGVFFDVHKTNLFEHQNSSEESNKHRVEIREIIVKAMDDSFPFNGTTSSSFGIQENCYMNDNDNNLKVKSGLINNEFENNKNVSIKCGHRNIESNTCSEEANHARNHIGSIKEGQDCTQKNKSFRISKLVTKNKNKEQNLLENDSRAIDLTKISVVRLKREKYTSKRYIPCDKNIKIKLKSDEGYVQINATKKDSTASRYVNNIGCSFPSITKSTLRRKNLSIECGRRRQQKVNAAMENTEPKCTAITTRLRHQRLQMQNKTESVEKNNKMKSKKKKIRLVRYQKPNERELSSDPDKLYLEVYRYKRALKIPPNLITIRNPCTQRMSASLPDLDLDLQNSLLKADALHNNKVEDVPKSIIDVLHSRVVKSKCQVKSIQKHSKNEHQYSSKLKMQRCNNSKLNFAPLNLCDNSKHPYRQHRNVFETQVLTSRTRMEYKMQLNKEVIREIFGGSERPASAPPEINNINSDLQIAFEKSYNCFQQHNFGTDKDIKNKIEGEHDTNFRICIPENLDDSSCVINSNSEEQTKGSSQSVMSKKCKRKRSGRPYRRKFSSGFDYLRKRKKSNAHALYNYSHLKTKVENYIAEANLKLKSENDVSREVQKWVLNKGVGQSALHKAARLGYIDVIVYCLEKMGLNPNHKDNAGYTPLHDACVNGSLEIAKVLLQYGANHSEGAHSGIRPLHEASENGHIEIVRMLLSYGADPLLETYSGHTPLMLASDPEMNDFIKMHLLDVQVKEKSKISWRFPGPWKIFDYTESGYDTFDDVSSLETFYHIDGEIRLINKNYVCADFHHFKDKQNNFVSDANGSKLLNSQNRSLKSDVREFEIFVDARDAEGELFEFEESNMPLPPLYLLKDEGMEKWVLLSDLCSLLKVKSKDTLLNKIFPSISPATVSRTFIRELKMCEFLEKATCLQLLCAGEKINICHSKVVLIQYNENVRELLGVKTIFMKF